MTDVPPGWAKTTLGEIADTSLGKMLDRGKATGEHAVPYLRNVNVQWGRVDLDDVLTMDIIPDERDFFWLEPGDLLVCEGGEIGRCAIWSGQSERMAYQKALHRVRPRRGVDAKYLRYLMEHMSLAGLLAPYSTGSTIKHLPQQQLRRISLYLPPSAEQRRIVSTLEGYLSHLDAAYAGVARVAQRLKSLTRRVLIEAVPVPGPEQWKLLSVADAGQVELGRARHPNWHTGPHMRPYLRVANVFEDRIDVSDLMEMDFPPNLFERYRLAEMDILLNEGQSPEYLGRPAIYRGVPKEVAFTNTLLRFRAGPDVLPEWALLVFRRHMHSGRFIREVRITTNIAHLSAERLKRVEFPVPPLGEQEQIITDVQEKLDAVQRFIGAVEKGTKRAHALRKSLLAEAFAGRLAVQDSADEPASLLLERLRAERAAQGPTRRTRRGKGDMASQKEALL
ncbi:MAG: restriction endonuclease subunit S [Streptosporangiales bacterium]